MQEVQTGVDERQDLASRFAWSSIVSFVNSGPSFSMRIEHTIAVAAQAELHVDEMFCQRNLGMQNARELYRMRFEYVDFDAATIFISDSKTEHGRRFIPSTDRVREILWAWCGARTKGWVWQSRSTDKHIDSAMGKRRADSGEGTDGPVSGSRSLLCPARPWQLLCCRDPAI